MFFQIAKKIKNKLVGGVEKEISILRRKQRDNEKIFRELFYRNLFYDSMRSVTWIKELSFSPLGASANYSFLFILFRILNEIQISSILELGAGETTKLTSQYIKYKNDKANLCLVEHDIEWTNRVQSRMGSHPRINVLTLPLKTIQIESYKSLGYENLLEQIKGRSFDLIINDGPFGSSSFSRFQIVDLIDNLKSSFVVIFDDYDRKGEIETVIKFEEKLKERSISYDYKIIESSKRQIIFLSKNYAFLKHIL